ncbi:tyrosine-type recombinase/integrase [Cupriavidus taiwanensis]|uniref:tyrosine-type recombinase/integrase n=1 Tax=Cupriavidus taiwanensis TaxID=164546 RepID=UPI001EFFC388|nr:site-specific integrase [Cupriavidus taiwanensis]
MIDMDVLSVIGNLQVAEVTARHISQVIDKVVDRGAMVKANRVLSVMRTMFTYAQEHGFIQGNPVVMSRKGAGGREKARRRVLSPAEIKTVWRVLDTRQGWMNWQTKCALKMVLITAQRPGECAGMQWEHVDMEKGIWTLPADFVKADRDHLVHLSQHALAILRYAQQRTGDKRHVFSSVRHDSDHVTPEALTRAVAEMLKAGEFGAMKHWTPHDLRRTASTGMANAGIYPHITEKILNHRMKGVLAVYNHGEYLPERRAAMELWGRLLEGWVGNLLEEGGGQAQLPPLLG